jgi:hypothetical protein
MVDIRGKLPETTDEDSGLRTFTVKQFTDSEGKIHNKLEVDSDDLATIAGAITNNKINAEISNLGVYPLKADQTGATANTDVVTVSQAGIKYADLANPAIIPGTTTPNTVTMYVWFGADPAAAAEIVLTPGTSWSGDVNNKADMRYKSSATGGYLNYVLRG